MPDRRLLLMLGSAQGKMADLNKSNTVCCFIRPTIAIYAGSNSLLGSKLSGVPQD